jgi:drug/metabolite transporter (DMT)-like permease
MVGLCISIGFPLLATYAMRFLPAAHGAIVIGLLPMATAYCISMMNHEKASKAFWLASVFGAVTVVGYAFAKSGGGLHFGDTLLLLAVAVGAAGYAHGAVVAKDIGGIKVMCWGLVISLPVLAIGAIPQFIRLHPSEISLPVWGAFFYLSLVSQLFGMALWYKALSLGSISRVSQIQLMQPFFTIIFAGLFFGEHIDMLTWAAAIVVLLSIQLARKSKVELR